MLGGGGGWGGCIGERQTMPKRWFSATTAGRAPLADAFERFRTLSNAFEDKTHDVYLHMGNPISTLLLRNRIKSGLDSGFRFFFGARLLLFMCASRFWAQDVLNPSHIRAFSIHSAFVSHTENRGLLAMPVCDRCPDSGSRTNVVPARIESRLCNASQLP